MLNRAWAEYCDTTKGNRWITVNTNPILNSKGTRLLARSGNDLLSSLRSIMSTPRPVNPNVPRPCCSGNCCTSHRQTLENDRN